MQRNVQARTRDCEGCLSYGDPTPRRNQASFRAAFRKQLYLRLVTQNLKEPTLPRRCTLLVEEGLSEFLEGNGFGEHMEHHHQDLVRDGHSDPLDAPARLQPVVLVLVVVALRPGGATRGLNEGRLEVDVALAGRRVLLLSGALVIAGGKPRPLPNL